MSNSLFCPSCQVATEDEGLLCSQCSNPLPCIEGSPYLVLGIEPRFDIDLAHLDAVYFRLQRQVHPDRFATADADVKERASEWSTRLNDSYKSLKDPLLRARALYAELQGQPPVEDPDNSTLLGDMMELQERLLEVPEKGREELLQHMQETLQHLADAFEVKLEKVPALIEKISYLQRLRKDHASSAR